METSQSVLNLIDEELSTKIPIKKRVLKEVVNVLKSKEAIIEDFDCKYGDGYIDEPGYVLTVTPKENPIKIHIIIVINGYGNIFGYIYSRYDESKAKITIDEHVDEELRLDTILNFLEELSKPYPFNDEYQSLKNKGMDERMEMYYLGRRSFVQEFSILSKYVKFDIVDGKMTMVADTTSGEFKEVLNDIATGYLDGKKVKRYHYSDLNYSHLDRSFGRITAFEYITKLICKGLSTEISQKYSLFMQYLEAEAPELVLLLASINIEDNSKITMVFTISIDIKIRTCILVFENDKITATEIYGYENQQEHTYNNDLNGYSNCFKILKHLNYNQRILETVPW